MQLMTWITGKLSGSVSIEQTGMDIEVMRSKFTFKIAYKKYWNLLFHTSEGLVRCGLSQNSENFAEEENSSGDQQSGYLEGGGRVAIVAGAQAEGVSSLPECSSHGVLHEGGHCSHVERCTSSHRLIRASNMLDGLVAGQRLLGVVLVTVHALRLPPSCTDL